MILLSDMLLLAYSSYRFPIHFSIKVRSDKSFFYKIGNPTRVHPIPSFMICIVLLNLGLTHLLVPSALHGFIVWFLAFL